MRLHSLLSVLFISWVMIQVLVHTLPRGILLSRFYSSVASFIKSRIVSADEAARSIPNKVTLAFSGFTPSGYPKAIPTAYSKRVEAGKKSGESFEFNVYTGASTGDELDGVLSRTGSMKYRIPYQTHPDLRSSINKGAIEFSDFHLSHVTKYVKSGALPPIDISIIEACDVTEDGKIYLTHAVGMAPVYAALAKEIYIELNERVPLAMKGMHDIPVLDPPPFTQPIPITSVRDRIGKPFIQVNPGKIKFIVKTNLPDSINAFRAPDEISQKIASHILEFVANEVKKGRIPKQLLPFQSGVGNVANAVLAGIISDKRFEKIQMYTEVLQDSIFDVIDAGKLDFASSTSLTLSPKFQDRLHNEIEHVKSLILLRPQEFSNNPEVIRRLGIIAMNTALEIDIYGNVNSTHVLGTSMMNGIGGSGDFTRNAYISIFMAPSTAKNGKISTFVPMVSHVDHNEHSVQVVVSEYGLADIRGLCPRKRAELIIKNCAHPMYRDQLMDYYRDAVENSVGKHTPHILHKALSWHSNFITSGTMLMH